MTSLSTLDPRKRSASEAPNSPWWALTDSLDAISNGMQNPQAFEALSLADAPELRSWKILLAAMAAFYRGDRKGCRNALDHLPADDPLAPLTGIFSLWLEGVLPSSVEMAQDSFKGLGKSLNERVGLPIATLYRALILPVHPLVLLADQAEEALRQGLPDRFESLAVRLFTALEDQAPDSPLVFRLALRFLHVADEAGCSLSPIFKLFERTVGNSVLLGLLHDLRGMQGKSASALKFSEALDALKSSFPPVCDPGLLEVLCSLLPGVVGTPEVTSSGAESPAQLELVF